MPDHCPDTAVVMVLFPVVVFVVGSAAGAGDLLAAMVRSPRFDYIDMLRSSDIAFEESAHWGLLFLMRPGLLKAKVLYGAASTPLSGTNAKAATRRGDSSMKACCVDGSMMN